MAKILLIGCGNMGRAMLEGWLAAKRLLPADAIVVEPAEPLRRRAADLGVSALADAAEISNDVGTPLVVLAVKPQMMEEVVPHYARFAKAGSAFLSIAAGTRIAFFEAVLGNDIPIIRCMPNTPAAIGKGMMVTVGNTYVDSALKAFVTELLSANGKVTSIDNENLMDAVTAVSGSGPAYVFHFIECLTAAGVDAGLPAETAALLAGQTVFGAASLADESSETPETLRRQVTSPNGTTAAALDVFMTDDRLGKLVGEAVEAAKKRSIELG